MTYDMNISRIAEVLHGFAFSLALAAASSPAPCFAEARSRGRGAQGTPGCARAATARTHGNDHDRGGRSVAAAGRRKTPVGSLAMTEKTSEFIAAVRRRLERARA